MTDRRFLLDTSAWICSFKPALNLKTKAFIESLLSERRVVTCGIVMLELLQGAVSEAEYKKLHEDPKALDFMEISPRIWDISYKVAFTMRRKGNLVPVGDCLIASLAIGTNVELIHADKHFDAIQKHIPLEAINILRAQSAELG